MVHLLLEAGACLTAHDLARTDAGSSAATAIPEGQRMLSPLFTTTETRTNPAHMALENSQETQK